MLPYAPGMLPRQPRPEGPQYDRSTPHSSPRPSPINQRERLRMPTQPFPPRILRNVARLWVPHPCAICVFSLMTSFTKCPGTSFTLPRWFHRPGESKDGVEDDGRGGTESAVCGGGNTTGEVADGAMSGVRDLASHRVSVVEAV